MKLSLPNTFKTRQGFTLVELMVVVAIIAILAAIGVTVFSGQQKNARDSRRKSDIDAIATALESKRGIATTYSALATTDFANGSIPVDSTTPQYSVCYSATAGASVSGNTPTAWAVGVANPTAPTAGCVGTAWATVSASAPAAATTAFMVCALLENGTNPTVYCRSNSQ